MRNLAFPLGTVLLVGFASAAAEPAFLPFRDVRPGMTGIGRTSFRGTEVVEFQVEIVGTLPDVGPDQNLIAVIGHASQYYAATPRCLRDG